MRQDRCFLLRCYRNPEKGQSLIKFAVAALLLAPIFGAVTGSVLVGAFVVVIVAGCAFLYRRTQAPEDAAKLATIVARRASLTKRQRDVGRDLKRARSVVSTRP